MGNNPSGFPFELGEKFPAVPQKVSRIQRWESPFSEDGWECYRGYLKNTSSSSASNTKKMGIQNLNDKQKHSQDLSSSSSSDKDFVFDLESDMDLHQVTIFKTDKGTGRMKLQPRILECNLHHYNRIKTLKHPCILTYVDGIELEKEILLVTEPVIPLLVWLQRRLKEVNNSAMDGKQIYQSLEEEIAWGFRCILKALSFLHDSSQKYSHCNINPNAIFVTRSGDWRLGSFQLLCEWKEYGEHVQHYIDCSAAQSTWTDGKYLSPEVRNFSYNLRSLIKDSNPGNIDIFAFGELMDDIFTELMSRYDLMNDINPSSTNGKGIGDRNKVNKISSSLAAILKRMKEPVAKNRPTCKAILNQSYFRKKPLNIILDFLENLSLKEDSEVIHFFESQLIPIVSRSYDSLKSRVNRQVSIPEKNPSFSGDKEGDENESIIPYNICVFKVFPLLRNYLHLDLNATNNDMIQKISSSSVKREDMGNMSNIPNSPCLVKALPILMNLFCMAHHSDFQVLMETSVCNLFSMNDRAVRCSLLYALPNIADKISNDNINMRIFDATLFGLNDSLLAMREATLKGLISLTDKLNDKNLNEKLIKSLTRLQSDSEPALRCNTTIFLGKIASKIKEGVRNRMLLPSIIKGLQDNFPHSRLASLKAMIACLMYIDEKTICTQVLPLLSFLLIDPDSMVRDQAFIALNTLIQKLSLYSEVLRQEENKRQEEAVLAQQQQHQQQRQDNQGNIPEQRKGIPSSSQSPMKKVVSSTAKSATSTANSLATWAVQKLVNVDTSDSPTSLVNSTTRSTQQPPLPPGPPPVQSRNPSRPIGDTYSNTNGKYNSNSIGKVKENNNYSQSKGMKIASRKNEEQGFDTEIKKLSISDDGWGDDDDFFGDESTSAVSVATAISIHKDNSPITDPHTQTNANPIKAITTNASQPIISVKETKVKDGWDDFNDDLDITISQSTSQTSKPAGNRSPTIFRNTTLQIEEKKLPVTNAIPTKAKEGLSSINAVPKKVKPQKALKLKGDDFDWDDF